MKPLVLHNLQLLTTASVPFPYIQYVCVFAHESLRVCMCMRGSLCVCEFHIIIIESHDFLANHA